MTTTEVSRPAAREVLFSRRIAAPVAVVWEAWSDVRHLHEWFGPEGFTTTTTAFAFEPGGVWNHTMRGPDGTDYPTYIMFREIEPQSRITYVNRWSPRIHDALEFEAEITFTPEGTGTRLEMRMIFASDEAVRSAVERYGVVKGGSETFDRLVALLS